MKKGMFLWMGHLAWWDQGWDIVLDLGEANKNNPTKASYSIIDFTNHDFAMAVVEGVISHYKNNWFPEKRVRSN